MRREFQETHERLGRKYLHMAVKDIFAMIQNGRAEMYQTMDLVDSLVARMTKLEERLDELEKRS